jgi:hypothetical protein
MLAASRRGLRARSEQGIADERVAGNDTDGPEMPGETSPHVHMRERRDLPDAIHQYQKEMKVMRASKLIVISTTAILAAGTDLAVGQGSLHSGSSMHGSSMNRDIHGSDLGGIRSHSQGPFYGRATSREMETGLNAQERSRLHDMVRDMPRISNVGTDIRINAIVPRHVREAAAPLPQEIQRLYPRFRQSRAFVHRDQIVIVNPVTSRIVAIVQS